MRPIEHGANFAIYSISFPLILDLVSSKSRLQNDSETRTIQHAEPVQNSGKRTWIYKVHPECGGVRHRSPPRVSRISTRTGQAMKLMDLNPQWSMVYRDFTPETGGIPTDDYNMSFRCPTCGPPGIVHVKIGPRHPDAADHRWQATPMPPDGPDWPSRLTLVPSINNIGVGHGPRHPGCSFHGTISCGEVNLS